MKVVLLKDVKGIGRIHETVSAADGHALNYLIPSKLAIAATPTAVKEAEYRLKQLAGLKEVETKLLEQNMVALAEARIVIKIKANEKGHLYDAVGKPELSQAAKEQAHIDLPEDVIKLEKSIKEVGTFEIPVATHDTFGKFLVTIETE